MADEIETPTDIDAETNDAMADILKEGADEPIQEEQKPDAKAEDAKAEEAAKAQEEADDAKAKEKPAKKKKSKAKDGDKPEKVERLIIGKQPKVEEEAQEDEPESKLLEDDAPESFSKKGVIDWKRLKDKANTTIGGLESDVASRDKLIVELRQRAEKSQDTEGMEKVKSENESLHKRLEQLDLANSPAYKEKYGNPIGTMTDALKEKLKEYDIPNSVDKLLMKKGKEFALEVDEIIKEMPTTEKQDVVDTVRAIQRLTVEADGAMTNAAEANKALSGQFDAQVEASFQSHLNSIVSEEGRMLDKIQVSDNATPEEQQYAIDRNASIDNMEAVARRIATENVSQDERNQAAVLTAWAMDAMEFGLPRIQEQYNQMVDKLESYVAEMENILDMNPDARADVERSLSKGDGDNHKGKDPDQAIESIVAEEIVGAR